MSGSDDVKRRRFSIAGQVQGVGFRPFVYRLAAEGGLSGWVLNDPAGVTVEVQGDTEALEEFCRRLGDELPPLAQITRCDWSDIAAVDDGESFEIRPSVGGELTDARITVDTAICDDCLREMNDPSDPRYRYPFINCTNCGPRYSLVTRVPYDRANTTMTDFAMCPLCAGEYHDPASRRFHAQPVACARCGPGVWLVDPRGRRIACDDPIAEAARMLLGGKIVAIKGLGGFHLACRADDAHAVGRLRRRKNRDAKPFAIMVADVDQARELAEVSAEAEAVLTGPRRPIVLLPVPAQAPAVRDAADGKTQAGRPCYQTQAGRPCYQTQAGRPCYQTQSGRPLGTGRLCYLVAEGLDTIGVMLPYTPLHHLLFAEDGLATLPLVMTSGNISEEPLVKDNDAAVGHLGSLADALLLHNRRIERRIDDSVVQVSDDGHVNMLRRARGYAPHPVQLSGITMPEVTAFGVTEVTRPAHFSEAGAGSDAFSVLAVGAELNSTICLLKNGSAVVSEHIGDLKDGRVYRHFIDTINHLEELFDVHPQVIAADVHPQYLSSEYAVRRGASAPLKLVRVQHHHAHVAACLAENTRSGPVIGLACDGTGYGEDGAVWGCEVLDADLRSYRRLGHLRYVHLPGGDAAAVDTFRPAVAAICDAFGQDAAKVASDCLSAVSPEKIEAAVQMLKVGANSPPSSSLGRWFDAVAAMCGVAAGNRFEGEAPMKLEAVVQKGVADCYSFRIAPAENGMPFEIDLRGMVHGIVGDLACRAEVGYVAAKFHNTVVRFLSAAARCAREQTGLNAVALSGGCFANRYVTAGVTESLRADGFEVLSHRATPCNDGCVALGQAVVAACRSGGNP